MTKLIQDAKNDNIGTSLAVLKPGRVINFIWEKDDGEWKPQKLAVVMANQLQPSLFEGDIAKRSFQVVKKLPYKFSYVFTTDDGVERTLMIEDWELGQLYWNCLKLTKGNEDMACQKVKDKYFDHMVNKCDLHFFLGTTRRFHKIAPNPFIIIGAFYPPQEDKMQLKLF